MGSALPILPAAARMRYTCPTELEPLTQALLRDLPSYMNRQYQRTVRPETHGSSYAIFASQPDFTPLPIEATESPPDETLKQVFFTVLQREYSGQRSTEFQQFNWLFLTRTAAGWQLALLFSRMGSYPTNDKTLLTPTRDTSQGLTAQSIRLWLRDCQAGAVKP